MRRGEEVSYTGEELQGAACIRFWTTCCNSDEYNVDEEEVNVVVLHIHFAVHRSVWSPAAVCAGGWSDEWVSLAGHVQNQIQRFLRPALQPPILQYRYVARILLLDAHSVVMNLTCIMTKWCLRKRESPPNITEGSHVSSASKESHLFFSCVDYTCSLLTRIPKHQTLGCSSTIKLKHI